MADGTVDNLNLQLSADAKKAVQSLNSLATSLKSINSAFSEDITGMRKFSKEIGVMSYAIKSLGKVNIPDLKGLNNTLKTLKDSDGIKASENIEKITDSISGLGAGNFNDNGISKTINALKRLSEVDMTKLKPEAFTRISDALLISGNIPDVSPSINRFVSAMGRLSSAGENTGATANDIHRLGQEMRSAAIEMQSVGAINSDVNIFVQSIGRLASAGDKTTQTASGLRALSDQTVEFFRAMQKAPYVSENTIRMTQALAQLASAGGKVGASTKTMQKSFSNLSSIGSKALSVMKKVGSGIASSFKKIGDSSSHLSKAQLSLKSLIQTAAGFGIGYALVNFGKEALELGSNIVEVENVVDVAFGSMKNVAYEFAETATENFGLSELAAKKYTGTMMAMLNSTGVARDSAAEMSTTLAGLAGDLASFYNITTDEAFMKLRSAIAGETEPMRQLGVNMTVAALQSYALSQGIDKSWQSMTQAEQAMLRYNYLMDATAQAQGDFARTSGKQMAA